MMKKNEKSLDNMDAWERASYEFRSFDENGDEVRVRNATPHPVTIIGVGWKIEILPSISPPRVATERVSLGALSQADMSMAPAFVPIYRHQLGEINGLPEPEAGVAWIVSRVAAEAASGRNDLFIPDEAVRDETGRIIGCRALARI